LLIDSSRPEKSLVEIDLPVKLEKFRRMGWIKSHRKGDTGIGKTIEDLLGIKENNLGEPDCLYRGLPVEIKCRRFGTASMITLFTLEAGTRHLHDVLLMKKYGYRDVKGRLALKITLTSNSFTPQGLKLEADDSSVAIADRSGYKPWIWTVSDIHLKLHNLCTVYADSKKESGKEFLRIRSATLLTGLNDKRFFDLVARGVLKIDLRMHLKPSGASRNHGTAFRLANFDELMKCYDNVETLLGETTSPLT